MEVKIRVTPDHPFMSKGHIFNPYMTKTTSIQKNLSIQNFPPIPLSFSDTGRHGDTTIVSDQTGEHAEREQKLESEQICKVNSKKNLGTVTSEMMMASFSNVKKLLNKPKKLLVMDGLIGVHGLLVQNLVVQMDPDRELETVPCAQIQMVKVSAQQKNLQMQPHQISSHQDPIHLEY